MIGFYILLRLKFYLQFNTFVNIDPIDADIFSLGKGCSHFFQVYTNNLSWYHDVMLWTAKLILFPSLNGQILSVSFF